VQPEGLQESSRWSERSADHRYRVSWIFPMKVLHPYRVLSKSSTRFRWSSLRFDHRLLSRSLSAGLSAKSTKVMLPEKGEEENLCFVTTT
jgi:hypothetical protein